MPKIKLKKPSLKTFKSLPDYFRLKWARCKILWSSLCYNSHYDSSYAIDTLMEPLFWFVDSHLPYFGPFFVGFLISMMGLVLLVAYFIIVPYEWMRKGPVEIVIYFIVGHYLLINTLFHYYAAYTTEPGFPPEGHLIYDAASICKHCIAPKPPRTHHCSVCKRCVLKMDHHCPWLNQCVGLHNHRYFLCTMAYMCAGCLFICIGMWPCFVDHYKNQENVVPWCTAMNATLFYAPWMCSNSALITDTENLTGGTLLKLPKIGLMAYTCVVFEFFTSAGVVVGVGALLVWHFRIISNGETSIEHCVNDETSRKFAERGKVYNNPYDFGFKRNWEIFLGVTNQNGSEKRSWLRRVFLPSSHRPDGDGLTWHTNFKPISETFCNDKTFQII